MKNLVLNNWASKVASFCVAVAVWYLVNSNEKAPGPATPVPGTNQVPVEGNPTINSSLLTPDPTEGLTTPVPGPDTSTPPVPPTPGL